MRKLVTLGLGVALAASMATSAFAGPSHAIVQELGSVVPAGEVNVDLGVVPLSLVGALGAGTQVGGGNATIGGSAIMDVTAGLGNGFEVRTGQMPGLSSKIVPFNVSGVTVKYAGFMPGLAVFGSYGSLGTTPQGAVAVGTTQSAIRFGAAYTMPISGWIVNGNLEMGTNTPNAGAATSTTDIAVAALYPLNANLLLGGEYLNTSLATGGVTQTASGFGLGGRIIAGNFTIDALLLANISTTATGAAQGGNVSQMGSPAMVNVNYKF